MPDAQLGSGHNTMLEQNGAMLACALLCRETKSDDLNWNKTCQPWGTLEAEHCFRRCPMARLFAGERKLKIDDVFRLLRRHEFGLREVEVAEMLGWERRTANNYLRDLKKLGRVYKEGRLWYAEE